MTRRKRGKGEEVAGFVMFSASSQRPETAALVIELRDLADHCGLMVQKKGGGWWAKQKTAGLWTRIIRGDCINVEPMECWALIELLKLYAKEHGIPEKEDNQ
jgi:hypothetical protein